MFENHAVWLTSKRSALQLGPAPYTRPASNENVVRNRAVAINPLDWLLQSVGDIIYPWLHYPLILGSDVAGEVVETGAAVTRFKVGDRVLGHAVGSDKDRNASSEGGFQRFTVLLEHMASPIPGNMPFEHAAVLPLGLSTAASALFQRDMLALEHPAYPAHPAKKANKTVLVWGGSTSVGCNAIQLAAAAGYKVIATASHNNREYLQELGASAVFDYRGKSAIADIVRAMKGQELAGALAIGDGAAGARGSGTHPGRSRSRPRRPASRTPSARPPSAAASPGSRSGARAPGRSSRSRWSGPRRRSDARLLALRGIAGGDQRIERPCSVAFCAGPAAGLRTIHPGRNIEMHPAFRLRHEAVEKKRRRDRARKTVAR